MSVFQYSASPNGRFWVQGAVPNHPYFDDEEKIKKVVLDIKNEVDEYLLQGLHLVFQDNPNVINQIEYSEASQKAWLLALHSQRYGVIYWINRETASTEKEFISENMDYIDHVEKIITPNNVTERVFNYAVHKYVLESNRRKELQSELVPPLAISSIGENHIGIRKKDFLDKLPEDSLNAKQALYDLHDFAHQTSATLSPELFGNKSYRELLEFPDHLKNLIKSPNLGNTKAVPFSDGLVFSQFLTYLFNNSNFENTSIDNVVDSLANKLAKYFKGEEPLYHPSSHIFMDAPRHINLEEVAVLVQNKFCELSASEIEQRVFTRSGNQSRGTQYEDELNNLSTSQRLLEIANLSNKWLYFEKRNTIKHRAHAKSYSILIDDMLKKPQTEIQAQRLVQIRDMLSYSDYKQGNRTNMYEQLGKTAPIYKFDKSEPTLGSNHDLK